MNELSLFTGAGGGILGTHLLGWTPIGYVEWDDYCQRVLAQRIADGLIPLAPIFGDVRQFVESGAAREYRGFADVVSAGFPCQPFSVAGRQRGADDERNMWPATRDVLCAVRPDIAWLENVPGLLATGYCERIFGDLAALGFDARWGVFPASAFGAPHRRERIFIAAHRRGKRVSRHVARQIRWLGGVPWGEDGGRAASWAERSGVPEPTIRRLGHGVAHGVERLRAAGNGQVPIVVREAWRLLS